MSATLTPYGKFSYGYALGENGWKPGYDENWQILDALLNAGFQQNRSTTTGLTWGYNSGLSLSPTGVSTIAAGTLTLTDNTTNFIERTSGGVVSTNVTGFTSGRIPLAVVITSSGAIVAVRNVSLAATMAPQDTVIPVTATSGTLTLNFALGSFFSHSVTAAVTTIAFTNIPAVGVVNFTLYLVQDGTGHAVTLPSLLKWGTAGSPSISGANKTDILRGTSVDAGTSFQSVAQLGY